MPTINPNPGSPDRRQIVFSDGPMEGSTSWDILWLQVNLRDEFNVSQGQASHRYRIVGFDDDLVQADFVATT